VNRQFGFSNPLLERVHDFGRDSVELGNLRHSKIILIRMYLCPIERVFRCCFAHCVHTLSLDHTASPSAKFRHVAEKYFIVNDDWLTNFVKVTKILNLKISKITKSSVGLL